MWGRVLREAFRHKAVTALKLTPSHISALGDLARRSLRPGEGGGRRGKAGKASGKGRSQESGRRGREGLRLEDGIPS